MNFEFRKLYRNKLFKISRLGFVGRGEGISSEAVVLLERDD